MKTKLPKVILLALYSTVANLVMAQNPPQAPTDFTATPDNINLKIHLSWTDNSNDETHFVLLKEWDDEFSHSEQINLPPNTTSFTDSLVAPNVQFNYTFWAENTFGSSGDEGTSATITIQVPPAPANVSASTGSMTSIQVMFTDNSNLESGYEIQHTMDPNQVDFYGSEFIGASQLDSMITYYVNDGPFSIAPGSIYYPPNTTVFVRVRAFTIIQGQHVYGPFSPIVSAVTHDVPEPPTDFAANLNPDPVTIRVSWTNPGENAAALLLARFVGAFNPNTFTLFTLPADSHEFIDQSADPHVTYTYRLVAIDLYEYSVYPHEYFYQLLSIPSRYVESTFDPIIKTPDITVEGSSPQGVQIQFIETNAGPNIAYIAYYSTSPNGPFEEDEFAGGTLGDVVTHQSNTGYEPNTVLFVKVVAEYYSLTGDLLYSSYPTELFEVTTLAGWPPEPTDFTAVAEGNHIKLTWTDHSLPDDPLNEAAWGIMRANDGGVNYSKAFTVPADTSTFIDYDVLPNITYTYRLESINDFGNSNLVYSASAMVPYQQPAAPVAKLASFVSGTAFTANWKPVAGADYYKIDVFNIKDSVYFPGYQSKIVYDTTLAVTGTKASRRYTYVVRAVKSNLESANSNTVLVTNIKDLILHTACSSDPNTYKRWQVINNNVVPVQVWWHVNETEQYGTFLANVGDSFFTTQRVSGLNKTTLTFYDDKLVKHTSVKSSWNKPCASGPDSLARMYVYEEEDVLSKTEMDLIVTAYPNPMEDKFSIQVSSSSDNEVEVSILNLQGQQVFTGKTGGKSILQVDAAHYVKGLYLVRALQDKKYKIVKVIKQ